MIIRIQGSDIDEADKDTIASVIYTELTENGLTCGLALSNARPADLASLEVIEKYSIQIQVERK